MNLKVQKRLAAQILHRSPKRIVFDNDRLEDIKQAITKRDLKLLIGDGAISGSPMRATSRVRARKIQSQKRKGRRKGEGSRKGSHNARVNVKGQWMNNIRVQRSFIKLLKDNNIVTPAAYRELYLKSKGGYFRSKRHIKLYLEDHDELLTGKSATMTAAKSAATSEDNQSSSADASKKPRGKTNTMTPNRKSRSDAS